MKTRFTFCGILLAAAFQYHARAGTLFYVPIPATGSDAKSGLDRGKIYTSGIAAGNTKEAGRTVNGVQLVPLSGSENSVTANGVTVSAATGTLANGGGRAESIKADGAMADLLSGMIFNDGAGDNSEQYVVLDPATLVAGKAYDLRVYFCNASGENRQVNLAFAGDGKAAVITDFFNEDDATTSGGGFADPNQVYYVNYRFTWDGVSTPGFTATQRFGSKPFCLFALTNQEVGDDVDARPAGAVVVHPAPIAEAPVRKVTTRTTRVDYDDEIGVSSEVFYSSDVLRRRGRWVTVGKYGRCWHPADVGDDWQPYTRGRWVHSVDDGWVWDSDEDFGWATYHYGRWFREEDSGWYWVPGRTWAPAWVSWRHGSSYVGWAPLPPVALAIAGVGIGSWADSRWDIGPQAYSFVNARDFGAPSLSNVIISRQQNVNIISNTNNVTNIVNNSNTIYNGGPSFPAMNNALVSAGAEPIPTVRVNRHANTQPVTPGGKFSQLSAGVLALSAPAVLPSKKGGSLPPVAATIAAPKIDKGWKGIPDPTKAAALQAKIAGETPGAAAKLAPATMPGTIPSTTAGTGTKGTGVLKPFRPGKPSDTAVSKPGQPVIPGTPATPGTTAFVKPGQPVKPTVGVPTQPGQPGQPATPGTTAFVKPGQPVQPTTPIAGNTRKKGEKPTVPTVPGTPGSPTVNILPKPGQPVVSATPTPAPGEQPKTTGKAPTVKPGKPGTPVTVAPPVTIPGTPKTPAAAPTPEPVRGKKGKPQTVIPAPVTPGTAPVIKPTVPVAPTPEPVRNPKRNATPVPAPVIKPAPTPEPVRIPKRNAPAATPVPAPVVKPAPAPEPVRIPKRTAPAPTPPPAPVVRPAPVARPTPPPAPVIRPAPAPVRPTPPVVVQPRPAPPVVVPPRPAPPVFTPPKPAPVPPAAPPAKGGKPTPTPTPING